MRVTFGREAATAVLVMALLVACNPGNQGLPTDAGPTGPVETQRSELPGTDPTLPGAEDPESPDPEHPPTQGMPNPTIEIPPPMD